MPTLDDLNNLYDPLIIQKDDNGAYKGPLTIAHWNKLVERVRAKEIEFLEAPLSFADGKLGIGTDAPRAALHIHGTVNRADDILLESFNNEPYGGALLFYRGRIDSNTNTLTAPKVNDEIGAIVFRGYHPDSQKYVNAAYIRSHAEGDFKTTKELKGDLRIYTSYEGSSKERLRITSNGNVGIGMEKASINAQLVVGAAFGAMISGSSKGVSVFGTNLATTQGGDHHGTLYTPNKHNNRYGLAGVKMGWGEISFFTEKRNTVEDTPIDETKSKRMLINSSGEVQIGSSILPGKLQISGNAGILDIEGQNHGYIQFYPKKKEGGRKAWIGFGNASTRELSIWNQGEGGLVLGTQNKKRLHIHKDGILTGTNNKMLIQYERYKNTLFKRYDLLKLMQDKILTTRSSSSISPKVRLLKTGKSYLEYTAAVTGFDTGVADIQENGAGRFLRVQMVTLDVKVGSKLVKEWFLRADLRTHNDNEEFTVDVCFTSRQLADMNDDKFKYY